MVTTYADDLDVLTELIATGNDLDGVKVHLATAMPALTGNMQVSDFTEASFTGSAAKTVTWGTPYETITGDPEVDSQLLTFIATATPASPETIIGAYITDAAGTKLIAADALPTPVTIDQSGKGLAFVVALQRYSGSLVQVP